MRRRDFIAICGSSSLFAWQAVAFAQSPARRRVVGVLASSNPAAIDVLLEAFRRRLAELGEVEGTNIVIERRYAEGSLELLPALAADLAKRNVDIIFAPNTVAVEAAMRAANDIPILFATVDDPVRRGFVANFARPGERINGISAIQQELTAKRVQILREPFSAISRIAVLTSSNESVSLSQFKEIQSATGQSGIQVFQ